MNGKNNFYEFFKTHYYINMGVGRGKTTRLKQMDLRDLFIKQKSNVTGVFKKYKDEDWCDKIYYLFDITAGDMGLGEKTSPEIFLTELLKSEGLEFRVCLIEKDKEIFYRLKENLSEFIKKIRFRREREYFKQNVTCCFGSNSEILDKSEYSTGKWKYGLVYFDPNRYSLTNF